jgi:hypothetical protein
MIAKNILLSDNNIFKNRFRISNSKIDGERLDSWRAFPVLNFKDIEGKYGEINKILDWKNSLFYFQDRGHGIQPINERAMINDTSGSSLVLGNGLLLGVNQYISTDSGTSHQQSVVASTKGVYYWDSSHKSFNIIQDTELSKLKGLLTFFVTTINDNLLYEDLPHDETKGSVVSIHDKKNNRIIMTLNKSLNFSNKSVNQFTPATFYFVGDKILFNQGVYECLIQGTYAGNEIQSSNGWKLLKGTLVDNSSITLSYNELQEAFESFYSYKPLRYLSFNNSMLAIHPDNTKGYIHTSKAIKCNFFETTYDSELTLVVNPTGKLISTFDNIEFLSEVSLNKEDLTNETLNKIHCWNEYQNTGEINLAIPDNIRRYIRTWRHAIPRDLLGSDKPRIRHYYIFMKVIYENNNNKRFVLNDIFIKYRPIKI